MSDSLSSILFDFARTERVGLPEAVFCQNKPRHVLQELLEKFANGTPPILFTRLTEDAFNSCSPTLQAAYDYDPLSRTAFAAKCPQRTTGSVAVISAGAADAPVAGEACRTLEYLGISYSNYADCGIAALWRLTERLESLNKHDALIVVAGMEGALASVVGGLIGKPIFATPTSVGYGVGAEGKAALASMLASCAPGVAVLNIDNGYGAACAAARVINQL